MRNVLPDRLSKQESDLRRRLEGQLGYPLLPIVWETLRENEWIRDALDEPETGWPALVKEARNQLRRVKRGAAELAGKDATTPRGPDPVQIPLGEHERWRAAAMSEYLAACAAELPRVRRWRREVLDGAVLTPERARRFCCCPALQTLPTAGLQAANVPLVEHRAELLQWTGLEPAGPFRQRSTVNLEVEWDGGRRRFERRVQRTDRCKRLIEAAESGQHAWVFTPLLGWGADRLYPPGLLAGMPNLDVPCLAGEEGPPGLAPGAPYFRVELVWDGSVLDDLLLLALWLAPRYHWPDVSTAAWFVLTDEAPFVPPVWCQEDYAGQPDHQHRRLELSLEPWVSARWLKQFYQDLQKQLIGHKNRPPGERNLTLFRYVWAQRRRHGKAGWEQLRVGWNQRYPQWRYDFVQPMRRDYDRARKSLIYPHYGMATRRLGIEPIIEPIEEQEAEE